VESWQRIKNRRCGTGLRAIWPTNNGKEGLSRVDLKGNTEVWRVMGVFTPVTFGDADHYGLRLIKVGMAAAVGLVPAIGLAAIGDAAGPNPPQVRR